MGAVLEEEGAGSGEGTGASAGEDWDWGAGTGEETCVVAGTGEVAKGAIPCIAEDRLPWKRFAPVRRERLAAFERSLAWVTKASGRPE